MEEKRPFWKDLILAVIAGGLAATLVGFVFHRKMTDTEEGVKAI